MNSDGLRYFRLLSRLHPLERTEAGRHPDLIRIPTSLSTTDPSKAYFFYLRHRHASSLNTLLMHQKRGSLRSVKAIERITSRRSPISIFISHLCGRSIQFDSQGDRLWGSHRIQVWEDETYHLASLFLLMIASFLQELLGEIVGLLVVF
ncbi:hypothetical protein Dsin_005157 [Dipteronia sinensis]|uniref:Uncharacterized protein n=1 Tax=Dipteronia sinensis TaxID=43782 RepID=A0AAE0EG85_9ROSI|nr:hypothetical protein Dsin_005157 [Dipteronia sinensis]